MTCGMYNKTFITLLTNNAPLNTELLACSRRRADLLAEGKNYISFHCDSNGNFEDLQCSNGLCWCVEPQSGKLISPVIPQKAMTKLPCCKYYFFIMYHI